MEPRKKGQQAEASRMATTHSAPENNNTDPSVSELENQNLKNMLDHSLEVASVLVSCDLKGILSNLPQWSRTDSVV